MIVDMWEKSEGAARGKTCKGPKCCTDASCYLPWCFCSDDKYTCLCDKQSNDHVVPLKPPTQEKEASPPYAY